LVNKDSQFKKHGFAKYQKNVKRIQMAGFKPEEITIKDEDGDENDILPFYWTDIQQHPTVKGSILVYGKVRSKENVNTRNAYVSAQLCIKNVDREIYFCLKKGENIKDLQHKVKGIMNKCVRTVKGQVAYQLEVVKKRYAFELEVDTDEENFVECVKATFSFKRVFKQELITYSGKFYKGVFGTSYIPTELTIVDKMLKGPGWIAVQDYTVIPFSNHKSWCTLEIEIEDSNDFARLKIPQDNRAQYPTPKMRAMFLKVQSKQFMGSAKNKYLSNIVAYDIDLDSDKATTKEIGNTRFFSIYPFHDDNRKRNVTNLSNQLFGSGFQYFNSEQNCLKSFIDYMMDLDPDFIIGHDIENDLRFLWNQMNKNQIRQSSIFGRWNFDFKVMRNIKVYQFLKKLTFGRLVLDTHSGAKEFKREVDYDIRYLAKKYFKILFNDKNEGNDTTLQAHQREIDYLFREVATSVKLNEKIQNLQLTKQLTNVGGCLWTHSLEGQRAVRIEYLLMHNFHKHDYIIPDKIKMQKGPGGKSKSAKYKGGYVLEPKAGLH
jgi:DNA polymerase alpha subunit A